MHILILSDGFSAPSYKPRLRSLSDWLVQKGHTIHVICEKADALEFAHNYTIEEVCLYKGGFLDWSVKNIGTMLFQWKERAFQREVEKRTVNKTYDIVFCTSFHTFPLRTANRIAAQRHIPVVLDLRDMQEQAPANRFLYLSHHANWLKPFAQLYLLQNIRRRNRELRKADAVITVSPWHTNLVKQITGKQAVYTIYNGYDAQAFAPKDIVSKQFKIIYTGKVFPTPQQDPALLFEALKQLHLSTDQLSIDWYCDKTSEALVRQLAQESEVAPWQHYHGQIAQSQIADVLHEASICLVLTSKAGDLSGHGKMTTKFFEALGVEKPVLCVESDEECLAAVIRKTNAGLSAINAQQVVAFIQEKYDEWKVNGYTHQAVVQEEKQLFSRQEQAQQFEAIFRSLVSKTQTH